MSTDDYDLDLDPLPSDDDEDYNFTTDWEEEWDDIDSLPDDSHPRQKPTLNTAYLLYGLLAIVMIAVVVGGAYLIINHVLPERRSPEETTRLFYESLNRKDFDEATTYVTPESAWAVSMLMSSDNLVQLFSDVVTSAVAETLEFDLPDFVSDLLNDIDWEFRNLEYTLILEDGSQATVEVSGQLSVSSVGLGIEIPPLPWNYRHDLIMRDGEWLIHLSILE